MAQNVGSVKHWEIPLKKYWFGHISYWWKMLATEHQSTFTDTPI